MVFFLGLLLLPLHSERASPSLCHATRTRACVSAVILGTTTGVLPLALVSAPENARLPRRRGRFSAPKRHAPRAPRVCVCVRGNPPPLLRRPRPLSARSHPLRTPSVVTLLAAGARELAREREIEGGKVEHSRLSLCLSLLLHHQPVPSLSPPRPPSLSASAPSLAMRHHLFDFH